MNTLFPSGHSRVRKRRRLDGLHSSNWRKGSNSNLQPLQHTSTTATAMYSQNSNSTTAALSFNNVRRGKKTATAGPQQKNSGENNSSNTRFCRRRRVVDQIAMHFCSVCTHHSLSNRGARGGNSLSPTPHKQRVSELGELDWWTLWWW